MAWGLSTNTNKKEIKMELPLGTAKCDVCSCLFSESEMFKTGSQVVCEPCTHKIIHDSMGSVTVERLYQVTGPIPKKG
jgi:DNA-directed RNA polymerase subunit RPC12/RpoP